MTRNHLMLLLSTQRNCFDATQPQRLAAARFSSALMFILAIAGCASTPPAEKKQLRYAEEVLGTNREELEWNFHSLLEYKSNDNNFEAVQEASKNTNNDRLDFCKLPKNKKASARTEESIALRGLGLQFPGYLVAIEKTKRGILGLEGGPFSLCSDEVVTKLFNQSFLQAQPVNSDNKNSICFMKRRLDDDMRMFLSHIASFQDTTDNGIAGITGRLIYDLYDRNDQLCEIQQAKEKNQPVPYEKGIFRSGHDEGLLALQKTLEKDISKEQGLKPYTHLFVYIMGWNTGQAEAIENFNNLFGYLLDAAGNDNKFKPLFIGITWPSAWSFGTGAWDNFLRGISFWNKKNDADEVGMTWANYLLNDVIAGVKREHPILRVVLVGHSFGARIASRTLYSCNLLPKPESCADTVDLVIGLQPAFGRSRFGDSFVPKWQEVILVHPMHHEGMPYTDFSNFRQFSAQQAYLWSRYDRATSATAMMGGANAVERTWEKPDMFEHLPAENYKWGPVDPSDTLISEVAKLDANKLGKKILMMDGSGFVRHDTPYHGGGAHSDIYNLETGRLTWELVKKFAPTK